MNTKFLLTSLSMLMILGTSIQFAFDIDGYAQIYQGHGHFHSLKEVLENRKVGETLACPNPEHVLVLRPNSNWACVYFETAKHLNWDTVLYSEPNYPQITKSFSKNDDYYYVTYQANEGTVDSVKYNIHTPAFEIYMTPEQAGEIIVTLQPPSKYETPTDYCHELSWIPSLDPFMYLIDQEEVEWEEISNYANHISVKIPYASDSKLIEILIPCHI